MGDTWVYDGCLLSDAKKIIDNKNQRNINSYYQQTNKYI